MSEPRRLDREIVLLRVGQAAAIATRRTRGRIADAQEAAIMSLLMAPSRCMRTSPVCLAAANDSTRVSRSEPGVPVNDLLEFTRWSVAPRLRRARGLWSDTGSGKASTAAPNSVQPLSPSKTALRSVSTADECP